MLGKDIIFDDIDHQTIQVVHLHDGRFKACQEKNNCGEGTCREVVRCVHFPCVALKRDLSKVPHYIEKDIFHG